MIEVVAFGELLIDFNIDCINEVGYPVLSANPGGAPANFLAALANCHHTVAFMGKVGDDEFGRLLIRTLSNCGIETRGIITDKSVFTTLSFVMLNEDGERSFSFARKPGADTCMRLEDVDFSLIDEAKCFHFGSLSLTNDPSKNTTVKLVEYAQSRGKLISFDPNLREPLWDSLDNARMQMLWGLSVSDIVKISDNEVAFLFGDNITCEEASDIMIKNYGVRLLYITMGKKGCFYSTTYHKGYVPTDDTVKTIDTVGAGDIFGGCSMSRFLDLNKTPEELSKEELHNIAYFASVASALSTRKHGGINSIPPLEEVLARMYSLLPNC